MNAFWYLYCMLVVSGVGCLYTFNFVLREWKKDFVKKTRDVNDLYKGNIRRLICRKYSCYSIRNVTWKSSLFWNVNAEIWPAYCNSYDVEYKKAVFLKYYAPRVFIIVLCNFEVTWSFWTDSLGTSGMMGLNTHNLDYRYNF